MHSLLSSGIPEHNYALAYLRLTYVTHATFLDEILDTKLSLSVHQPQLRLGSIVCECTIRLSDFTRLILRKLLTHLVSAKMIRFRGRPGSYLNPVESGRCLLIYDQDILRTCMTCANISVPFPAFSNLWETINAGYLEVKFVRQREINVWKSYGRRWCGDLSCAG